MCVCVCVCVCVCMCVGREGNFNHDKDSLVIVKP